MSFNIKHDEDDFWSVEFVSSNWLNPRTTGRPPRNFSDSSHVMTTEDDDGYHIFYLSDRAYRVIRTIQRENPSVLVVQEAFKDQVNLLAHVLKYKSYARGRNKDPEDGETNGILWNPEILALGSDGRIWEFFSVPAAGTFWLSSRPDEPGSIDPWPWGVGDENWGGPDLPRICTWVRLKIKDTGRWFYVFNTHLQNDDNADDGELNRMKSVELIIDRIAARRKRSVPVILTGDFNDSPNSKPIRLVTESTVSYRGKDWTNPNPMVDSFRHENPNSTLGTKCSGGGPSGSRIDYVFTWSTIFLHDATIVSDYIGNTCPSDHAPITALLSIPR